MGMNILKKYYDYISSIPEDQLTKELIEAGIEDYIVKSEDISSDVPSFRTNEKISYDLNQSFYSGYRPITVGYIKSAC